MKAPLQERVCYLSRVAGVFGLEIGMVLGEARAEVGYYSGLSGQLRQKRSCYLPNHLCGCITGIEPEALDHFGERCFAIVREPICGRYAVSRSLQKDAAIPEVVKYARRA